MVGMWRLPADDRCGKAVASDAKSLTLPPSGANTHAIMAPSGFRCAAVVTVRAKAAKSSLEAGGAIMASGIVQLRERKPRYWSMSGCITSWKVPCVMLSALKPGFAVKLSRMARPREMSSLSHSPMSFRSVRLGSSSDGTQAIEKPKGRFSSGSPAPQIKSCIVPAIASAASGVFSNDRCPPRICGGISLPWNRRLTTIPRLMPLPPRRPQNRSEFSVAFATSTSPLASTTRNSTTASVLRPSVREVSASPPPTV
mmetsp:Transcript_51786/g.124712  ORF Transcript_51786/g.124712 Transcript_51786/m.124712 type:complete len:255 (-) Transcript_51786:455-1219(-)